MSFLGMLKRGFTSILKLLQCNHYQKNFFCLFVFYVHYYYYFYYFFFFLFFFFFFFFFYFFMLYFIFFFFLFLLFFFFFMTFFFFCQIPITSFLGMLKRGFTSILKLLQCNHCQKNFFVLMHFVIVESLDMQISHVQGTL